METEQQQRVEIVAVKLVSSLAGQFQVNAQVQYPGEDAVVVGFVGSEYGGPVVMISPTGNQMFVTDPGRFGDFGVEWVRRFFS